MMNWMVQSSKQYKIFKIDLEGTLTFNCSSGSSFGIDIVRSPLTMCLKKVFQITATNCANIVMYRNHRATGQPLHTYLCNLWCCAKTNSVQILCKRQCHSGLELLLCSYCSFTSTCANIFCSNFVQLMLLSKRPGLSNC